MGRATFLQLLAILSFQYGSVVVYGQYVLSSSCGGVVTEGERCVLICSTGSVAETSIVWTRGGGVTFSVEHATCENSSSPVTIPDDYDFACPGTNYTLTIKKASVTRDKTTWICDALFGGKDSTITLDVQATTTTAPTTTAPGPDDECDFPFIAIIILAILLVVKIATDVIFVLYRWTGFFTGISVQRVFILYWSCFVQGIIGCVIGVIFLIVICAAYIKCLSEGISIGALILIIITIIIGAVNILLSCCCFKPPRPAVEGGKPGGPPPRPAVEGGNPGAPEPSTNAGGPPPWFGCCCPQSRICSGEESPESPPAPIPAAMASPRKPVPPNSTSARPLPSPTSDPASDSAVNPRVLEPLNVEESKKKKKKRTKKRKSAKEAGGESSEQAMNAAGDTDED